MFEEVAEMALDVVRGPIVFWGLAATHFVVVWVPDIWRRDRPALPARFFGVEQREGPPGMWAVGMQTLMILEHTVRRALESPDKVDAVQFRDAELTICYRVLKVQRRIVMSASRSIVIFWPCSTHVLR